MKPLCNSVKYALIKRSWFLVIMVVSLLSHVTIAQVEDISESEKPLYKIVKVDGREYVGTVLKDDGREVLINTKDLGDIYIPKSDIASMKEVDERSSIIKGTFRESGPFTTRYYFTNNALPIHKGEHYAMVHLYGPEVHFAVADRLSIGVMATWIASPIGIAAKYSIPTSSPDLNFSIGTIFLSSGYLFQSQGYGGLHWLSGTYGQAGKNVTMSLGYGYLDLGFGNRHDLPLLSDRLRQGPVLGIAGILPVGEKASFLFDSMTFLTTHHNYESVYPYAPGQPDIGVPIYLWNAGNKISTVLMPAMRFQKNERSAFQVSLAGLIEYSSIGFDFGDPRPDSRSIPFPMCSWFITL